MNFRAGLGQYFLAGFVTLAACTAPGALLPAEFAKPPAAARPWVYAFWMEGNVTKEGITADLEGMKAQGIGGFLFMDGALGNPDGPHRFMSDSWREMFKHMLTEADRLGLQVNLNNDPGWAGSGGPWVKPEQAAQKVIASESIVEGPSRFAAPLPVPPGVAHGYYRDIAVLAYPAPATAEGGKSLNRIPEVASTKSFAGGHDFAGVVPWPRYIASRAKYPAVPREHCIAVAEMKNLTAQLGADGKLTWDVPPGRWMVLRIGHTVANGELRSAQKEANGLESDKLSRSAIESHFNALVGKLAADIGPLAGKTLVSTHIDSWESGSGNWTDGFRDEFRRRRGYDPLPYLPTMNGLVVDNMDVSERFLWDYRETVGEVLLENYAEHFRQLAHKKGLRLSIEAYDGTIDDLRFAGRADEPMSEFWQRPIYNGLSMCDLSEGMASAAHVYGKEIVGAEALTARWGDFLDHPALFKPLVDWAFCTGVNRLNFSEWVIQPWPHLAPGVSFMDLGSVFHQSLTWWKYSRPWHEYIARCQYLLRQGNFVADVCFMTPEGAPGRFTPPIPATARGGVPGRPAYNFDGCPPELVLGSMKVQDGRVTLPSGMSYRLLVLPTYNAEGAPVIRLMDSRDYFYKPTPLPRIETMTPQLLRRIKELVEAGATILGYRPLASPSLVGYPECDAEVKRLADELWGSGAGESGRGERKLGKGRVVWGSTPEDVLTGMSVPPDFACSEELKGRLNYIHRRTEDGADLYFVANQQDDAVHGTVSFRTSGRKPEWWWPQSGRTETAAVFEEKGEVTEVPISLHANESVFVVFREPAGEHLVSIARTDGPRPAGTPASSQAPEDDDSFTVAAWVRPGGMIVLPDETAGGWRYSKDMEAPGAGFQAFASPGRGLGGFVVGANGIVVFQYGKSGLIEPLLAYGGTLTGQGPAEKSSTNGDPLMMAPYSNRIHIGVVYKDRVPHLFIDGKRVMTGPKSRFPRRSGAGWADRRFFAGDLAALERFDEMLVVGGHADLVTRPKSADSLPAFDATHRDVWQSGKYLVKTSEGLSREWTVALPRPWEIAGPWQVEFDPKWGGPEKVGFDRLEDWSARPESGIKYYSGAATYRKTFRVKPSERSSQSRVYLDLGQVAVMANVKLNGKDLGVLWNPPYRVDVTEAINADGENTLEVTVANLWVNRLIGDEHLPEDSERDADGTLKSWPQWIQDGKASPTGRYTFTTRRVWKKNDPLVKSGLLGPVRILHAEHIKTR